MNRQALAAYVYNEEIRRRALSGGVPSTDDQPVPDGYLTVAIGDDGDNLLLRVGSGAYSPRVLIEE